MTSHRYNEYSLRSFISGSYFRVLVALILGFSVRNASADYDTWNGTTSSDWDTAANWTGRYATGEVPQPYDNAEFTLQSPNMDVTFSQPSNHPSQLFFGGNGDNYTLGSLSDTTDGLQFSDYAGVYEESSISGTGGNEEIDAPIEGQSRLFLTNWSPASQEPTLAAEGVAGYNNSLTIGGNVTMDNSQALFFMGLGNINVNGNLNGTSGANLITDTTSGTVTLSGTSSFTGNSAFGGNVVLDYTTNNTQKISPTSNWSIGFNYANYNGFTAANGGNVTINANQTDPTTITAASTNFTGSSLLVINGSNDPGVATTVNFGTINPGTYGGATDITTNGNVTLYTNNTNAGTYGSQILTLGQFVTMYKSYWAQAGGDTYASDGNGGYDYNSTPVMITPLLNDDGALFNNSGGDFHVDSEASDVQVLSGGNEGADTIRFTNENDPFGYDITSAHTLDLGGGDLYMNYGGIMATVDVVGDTNITDGTIHGGINGLSIINYSTGTLNISANIAPGAFAINGGGTVELSGNNEVGTNGQALSINAGKLILGSAGALGTDNQLAFGGPTATLDLNGQNIAVSRLFSDVDYLPGNVAANAGLNSNIINSAGGTLSTIKVEGDGQSNNNDSNVHTGDLYGDQNLGQYTGGINEASGAIISLDIEQGSDTNQVEFLLGTANPIGDQTGANTNNIAGIEGAATEFSGAITVGKNANLGLNGYGLIETLGSLDLYGNFGGQAQQLTSFGSTYLTGTGNFVPGYQGAWGYDLNTVGSAADTFNGTFGTSSGYASMYLVTTGTGTVNMVNPLYAQSLTAEGTSTLITPALANGYNVSANAEGKIDFTANSGTIGGNLFLNQNGEIAITPSGSGNNVVVSATNNTLQFDGDGTLLLNQGANTSLTLQLGSTGNNYNFNGYNDDQALTIAVSQGLSALGSSTGDKLIVLSNGSVNSSFYGNNLYSGGIVSNSVFGQNASAGSTLNATYLSYNGTGATTDQGFVAYNFGSAFTDNLNNLDSNANYGSVDKIDTAYTNTNNVYGVYGLEIDNATLVNNNNLNVGDDNRGSGGIILNGGSITGNGVNIDRFTSIYTSLANGTISYLGEDYGGQDVAKDGAGTLFIGSLSGTGRLEVNEGALDLGSALSTAQGPIFLNGGVIQGSGTLSATLANQVGGVNLVSGGFSARGGNLKVNLTDASGSTNLVWGAGGTFDFLGQGDVLQFGSLTADSAVNFTSNLNLGIAASGNQGSAAIYSRVIDVTANASDSGDPLKYSDRAIISGTISSSNVYSGLAKDGTGVLVLSGNNTYTGATTIANGTLAITSDSNLGTAPTAASALNTAPGYTGNALTDGAIEINGGASLAVLQDSHVVLNSDRQMLLASGTTGQTASILNIQGNSVDGYSEMDFGGTIADYINEVGSLQKQGGGTFDYTGTSDNTGTDSVVAGNFDVSGSGSVNSVSGIVVNNQTATSAATFNYSSSVGLTQIVSYGSGGGTFAYNSSAAYTGGAVNALAHDIISGAGNLGTTHVTVGAGGTILPGNVNVATGTATPGMLTAGGVTLLAGGNYNFLLADANGAAGIGYGTVQATSVDLTGLSSTMAFSINLETLNGNIPGAAANFNGSQDYSFTLFNTGVANGITGLTSAQLASDFSVHTTPNNGATGFDPANGIWSVGEAANDSSLVLNYTAVTVPEPSVWAMMLGGVMLLVFIRRLRSKLA